MYAFNKTAKTVTISGFVATLKLEQLLAIVNVNTNTIMYQPNKVWKWATLLWYVFTLDYDTSSMNNSDELMIIMELPDILINDNKALETWWNLASIASKDFSTSAKQDTWNSSLTSIDWKFTTLNAKDFATQTTLAQIKAKTDNLDTALSGIKTWTDKIISAPATEAKQLSDNHNVTANAWTDLNTSLLAKESWGNLAALAWKDFATETTLWLIKNIDWIKKIVDDVTVKQSTSSNLKGQMEWLVADNWVDSWNPIKVWWKYNATPPIYSDGDRVDFQTDSNWNLKVSVSSDIQMWAVELKNWTDDTRATIKTRGSTTALDVAIVDALWNQITTFWTPAITNFANETGWNLDTVKTNTDSLVTSGWWGYIRQDSTATIAKESGGNLATIAWKDFATQTKQSDWSQKTQLVDGSGNIIGSTSNALDINIKSGWTPAITWFATENTLVLIKDTDWIKKITDALPAWANIIGSVRIDQTTPWTTNWVVRKDTNGNPLVSFGWLQLPITHWSPMHFNTTYTSNVSITISNASFSVDDSVCYTVSILYKPAWWQRQRPIINWQYGYSIVALNNVLTVNWAWTPFASGDTYIIWVNYLQIASDITTDTQKISNQNPTPSYYIPVSLDASTNNTAWTFYYPSSLWDSLDNYKFLSIDYTWIDADGIITMSVEMTNRTAPATTDFKQVFWEDDITWWKNNSRTVNNWTLNSLVSFNNANYSRYRVKVVFSGSTNTSTLDIRKVY